MRRLIVLLVATATVTACSSGKAALKPLPSAAALRQLLGAERVGCDGFEEAAPGQKQKYVNQQAYCQIQGESAELYVFKTDADLQNWIKLGIQAACSSGFPALVFVRGPNWIVQPETTAVTQVIEARVGGSAEVHNCSP